MEPEKKSVILVMPSGKKLTLDDSINLARERAIQTGLPTGLGGHAITCPEFDKEVAPECYVCDHTGMEGELGGGLCKLGIHQNMDYSTSERYNITGNQCESYRMKKIIAAHNCNCGLSGTLQ